MNIVFDTNVILSSFLTEGITNKVFNHCVVNNSIYISEFIIGELTDKLIKKFNVKPVYLEEFLSFIKSNLFNAMPDNKIPKICRDKKDNQILQLTEFINADLLISGDKDLLVLSHYKETKIISPRDFFNLYLAD